MARLATCAATLSSLTSICTPPAGQNPHPASPACSDKHMPQSCRALASGMGDALSSPVCVSSYLPHSCFLCSCCLTTCAVQILAASSPLVATLMANQTAVHAIPAAINRLTEALLEALGAPETHVHVVNQPMPEVPGEQSVKLQETAGMTPC